MKSFIVLISVLAFTAAFTRSDYCKLQCTDYRTHRLIKNIGCTMSCPKKAKIVEMTNDLKTIIVDAHNEYRNYIAGGNNKNYKPACRMATMEWDDELAYLAILNVRQCKMNHDKCRKTDYFEFSGQNLGQGKQYPAADFDYKKEFKGHIQKWYNEEKECTQDIIDKFPESTTKKIGHFTAMMVDRNIRVGCSAVAYKENAFAHNLFACNYATNNMPGFPIYAKCQKPGEDCKTGLNKKYTNLCSNKEVYDVNNWF